MKTKVMIFLLAFLMFGSAYPSEACGGQTIKIQVNHERAIPDSDLVIKFASVLEDSRCPVDTKCVRAGNAKIQIEIIKADGARQIFELNSNAQPETITFENFKIKLLDLAPKLKSNIRINRNGYVATLSVQKIK